ncbi:TPA: DNA topoisomerase III [Salmonella enterica]|uniref:DNA topoisomerase III n=1 Tax=Salmonella enterica TaxID=28901 RepID=UPI0009AFF6FF|nr:DNA topoisomerase III [Salmonella enterica]HBD1844123.1 DNA topoisomerase III [Salmonella enterica]
MQLYLCEKPSQAKDIAKVLGASQRGQGYIGGNGLIVTWAVGHLLETASPEAYGEQFGAPWRMDALPILPDPWQMTVKKDTADQFNVINRLLKQVDEVVIATDSDREGEVIARELLEYCRFSGSIKRLWLSALDMASVRQALANMLPGEKTEGLYFAGLGRARADWLIGMNMTRLYTLKGKEQGVNEVLSIGRVQTPTLALVVYRDNAIANFVPKPYWQVITSLEKDGIGFSARWVPAASYCDDGKRCIQQNIALAVEQLCRQQRTATVMDVATERKSTPAPLCFDLGTLQQVCSRRWGMSVNQVLSIAQSLYETHKATTYPRTDCGFLPVSMQAEIPDVLGAITRSDPGIVSIVTGLNTEFVSRVWNDKEITAHHAIIPTRQSFDITKLSADELKVYQLIRQHYLAQFLPLQESDVTDVTLNIGGQLFATRGNVNVVTGWKSLFGNDDEEDIQGKEDNLPLPALCKNDVCRITGAEIKSLQTKPPSPFTEGSLVAAMKNAASMVNDPQLKKILRDNAGLGTEATRAGIIETLFKRNYLEKKGKTIQSTALARELIAALPDMLTSPGTTALWEQALDDVAQGKMTLDSFMQKQIQWTRHLVEKGRTHKIQITAPVTPPCPVCGGITRKRNGANGPFWGCVNYPTCSGVVSGTSRKTRRKANKNKVVT